MNSDLSPIQKVLLETFKSFALFCKENDITYFAAYGTLIGAIRHKGFIPWDDDMDVYMERSQYDKFLALKEKLANTTSYKIADFRDKGYPYDFAKYYDTTKTFWEYPQFPFVMGPFVDVFPLDSWDDKSESLSKFYDERHEIFWKYRKSISHQTWKEIGKDFCHLNVLDGFVKLVKKSIYNPQYKRIYKRLESFENRMSEIDGPYYKVYTGVKRKKYDKEWFKSGIEVPFEDTTIVVPVDYNACLTYEYGDYMTPPVEHARTGHHTAYYINLERHIGIDEILKEKSKELVPKQGMGVSVLIDEVRHRKGFR